MKDFKFNYSLQVEDSPIMEGQIVSNSKENAMKELVEWYAMEFGTIPKMVKIIEIEELSREEKIYNELIEEGFLDSTVSLEDFLNEGVEINSSSMEVFKSLYLDGDYNEYASLIEQMSAITKDMMIHNHSKSVSEYMINGHDNIVYLPNSKLYVYSSGLEFNIPF